MAAVEKVYIDNCFLLGRMFVGGCVVIDQLIGYQLLSDQQYRYFIGFENPL